MRTNPFFTSSEIKHWNEIWQRIITKVASAIWFSSKGIYRWCQVGLLTQDSRWASLNLTLAHSWLSNSPRTANRLHDLSHGFQFLGCPTYQVHCPVMESNFGLFVFEPQAQRLNFTCNMTALNVNLGVLAGKLHNVTFGVITRNITLLIKTRTSHWFI